MSIANSLLETIKHRITLRLSIALLLIGIGLLSLISLVFTSNHFKDIALENEKSTFDSIIHLRIVDELKGLRGLTREMGESMRKEPGLLQAIEDKKTEVITHILDDQFAQYYTTSGLLKLEKVFILDKHARIVAHSNKGYQTDPDKVPMCNNIIETVSHRKGAARLKTKSGLCKYDGVTFFGAMMPLSGLVPKSFVLIILDPTYTIKRIESDFGDPIRITQSNGVEVYRSALWPLPSAMDDFLVLKHEHVIHDISDTSQYNDKIAEHAFTYELARNTQAFENRFGKAISVNTVIGVLIISAGVIVSLFLLHAALNPLRKLQESSTELSHGEYIPLEESFFPEINTVTNSFNRMANDISRLIDNLQLAYDRADNANRVKSQFLANMSHEIRTPLTAVLGYAEALLDTELDENQRNKLNTIINSGAHLREIINDILDLSKIEAGKLDLEQLEVSPLDLLSNVATIFSHQIKNKGLECAVSFEYPFPKTITTDPVRVKQILLNMVSNALKFTAQGSINIKLGFDQSNELLLFKIADTGIGMTEEELSKIFQPFTQADATTTRKYGGTGLGLTLSSQLAKMLGGKLAVESEKGKGTCFTLTVSTGEVNTYVYEGAKLNIESKIENLEDEKQFFGNILLAEDTPALQELIALHLRKMGINVSIAQNGREAVDSAMKRNYDLILMDMQMPVMSGIEAVESLRANGYTRPIIAMTANAMRGDQEHYLQIGCDDYVAKPIDKNRFRQTLERYLDYQQNMDSMQIVSNMLEDEPDLIDILAKFVASLPKTLHNIQQAAEKEQWEEMAKFIHALKGTGGGYGYPQLTDICKNIEKSLESADFSRLKEQIEILGEIINGIDQGLKKSA